MSEHDFKLGLIRTTCRSSYDLQKLRIQNGNRIAGNFKVKIGQNTDGMSEAELDAIGQKVLKRLRISHKRITDAIVIETGTDRPTRSQIDKKFKPDDLITIPAELHLIDTYVRTLETEERHFEDMGRLLDGIPIYDEFLKSVSGVGPAMAGVILSEIDIHKAEYPSSLWKYAGLDVVTVIEINDGGKSFKLNLEQATENPFITTSPNGEFFYKDQLCNMTTIGRNRQAYSLVKRPYEDREGEQQIRNSITYNPFLKTKLVGVLAGSFLKVGGFKVDGKSMGLAKRLELATSLGFDAEAVATDDLVDGAAIDFLIAKGMVVERAGSPYSAEYYRYKMRLDNNPAHREKTAAHRHRMAMRYMIKRFLLTLHIKWRELEGLPVSTEYSEGVLHMKHGQSKGDGGSRQEQQIG